MKTFEILELRSVAKSGDPDLNEDSCVVTDYAAAVFDGATDKNDSPPPTPGRLAAVALAERLAEISEDLHPEALVKELHAAVAPLATGGREPTAVAAVVHVPSRQVIRVGDVAVGINGAFDIPRKRIDEIAGDARAALLGARLSAGASMEYLLEADPGREMILPLLRESRQWRNRPDSPYGFAAIDGAETPVGMIDVFDVPPRSEVVLATDGYPSPQPTLAASERVLAESISRDPLRLGPPAGTKGVRPGHDSFDDRTYLRMRL